MIRRRLGLLLATLALGLTGGTVAAVAGPAPAQAGTFSCGAKYFLKAASTGRYLTIWELNGQLLVDRTHKGWWEQFTVCRDSSWDPKFFVLKSDALSYTRGAASYLEPVEGSFIASPHTLTNNDLFEWRGGNPYWGLVHAGTRAHVTVVDYAVYPGPNNLGWGQAFYRES